MGVIAHRAGVMARGVGQPEPHQPEPQADPPEAPRPEHPEAEAGLPTEIRRLGILQVVVDVQRGNGPVPRGLRLPDRVPLMTVAQGSAVNLNDLPDVPLRVWQRLAEHLQVPHLAPLWRDVAQHTHWRKKAMGRSRVEGPVHWDAADARGRVPLHTYLGTHKVAAVLCLVHLGLHKSVKRH